MDGKILENKISNILMKNILLRLHHNVTNRLMI